MDLHGGELTPLARRKTGPEPGRMPFTFFHEGLKAGRQALSPNICLGADLIIVDEVGPLELSGKGWARFLGPLLRLKKPKNLWVVRTGLVDKVCRAWSIDSPLIVEVTEPQALARLEQAGAAKTLHA